MTITADDLSKHLRLPAGQDEDFLEQQIFAAISRIEAASGISYASYDPLPADLRQATLVLAANYFVSPEAAGTMPEGVAQIVDSYRSRWF